MKLYVERIEFSCRTANGKVAYYLDLVSEEAWGEVYPNDFSRMNVKPAPTKPLSEVQTKDIIEYFKAVEGQVWMISDWVVSAKFRDFKDFCDAAWYVVNKVRKHLRERCVQ